MVRALRFNKMSVEKRKKKKEYCACLSEGKTDFRATNCVLGYIKARRRALLETAKRSTLRVSRRSKRKKRERERESLACRV